MCFHEGHKLKHVALTTFNMKTHYSPSAPPTWYKQEVQTASFVGGHKQNEQHEMEEKLHHS